MAIAKANLDRGGIYFAGESVEVSLSFSFRKLVNEPSEESGPSSEGFLASLFGFGSSESLDSDRKPKGPRVVRIAKCSAHLQCTCKVNPGIVNFVQLTDKYNSLGIQKKTTNSANDSTTVSFGRNNSFGRIGRREDEEEEQEEEPRIAEYSMRQKLLGLSKASSSDWNEQIDEVSGRIILTSPLTTLGTDIVLEEDKVMLPLKYSVELPRGLPPSYRGHSVAFSYRIIVNVRGQQKPVKTLQLPVKVLSMREKTSAMPRGMTSSDSCASLHSSFTNTSEGKSSTVMSRRESISSNMKLDDSMVSGHASVLSTPGNANGASGNSVGESSFAKTVMKARVQLMNRMYEEEHADEYSRATHSAEAVKRRHEILQNLVNLSTNSSTSKPSHFFNIQNKDFCVTKFRLRKKIFRIGEDIMGMFDFSGSKNCICHQISVYLESEETVNDELRVPHVNQKRLKTRHTEQSIKCVNTLQSHVIIRVPETLNSQFTSPVVDVKFKLLFEFIVESLKPENEDEDAVKYDENSAFSWSCKPVIKTSVLTWRLPIEIIPTSPANIPYTSPSQSTPV
eukprot:Nk52_evm46s222 gene=Nk52_evmTU46s222